MKAANSISLPRITAFGLYSILLAAYSNSVYSEVGQTIAPDPWHCSASLKGEWLCQSKDKNTYFDTLESVSNTDDMPTFHKTSIETSYDRDHNITHQPPESSSMEFSEPTNTTDDQNSSQSIMPTLNQQPVVKPTHITMQSLPPTHTVNTQEDSQRPEHIKRHKDVQQDQHIEQLTRNLSELNLTIQALQQQVLNAQQSPTSINSNHSTQPSNTSNVFDSYQSNSTQFIPSNTPFDQPSDSMLTNHSHSPSDQCDTTLDTTDLNDAMQRINRHHQKNNQQLLEQILEQKNELEQNVSSQSDALSELKQSLKTRFEEAPQPSGLSEEKVNELIEKSIATALNKLIENSEANKKFEAGFRAGVDLIQQANTSKIADKAMIPSSATADSYTPLPYASNRSIAPMPAPHDTHYPHSYSGMTMDANTNPYYADNNLFDAYPDQSNLSDSYDAYHAHRIPTAMPIQPNPYMPMPQTYPQRHPEMSMDRSTTDPYHVDSSHSRLPTAQYPQTRVPSASNRIPSGSSQFLEQKPLSENPKMSSIAYGSEQRLAQQAHNFSEAYDAVQPVHYDPSTLGSMRKPREDLYQHSSEVSPTTIAHNHQAHDIESEHSNHPASVPEKSIENAPDEHFTIVWGTSKNKKNLETLQKKPILQDSEIINTSENHVLTYTLVQGIFQAKQFALTLLASELYRNLTEAIKPQVIQIKSLNKAYNSRKTINDDDVQELYCIQWGPSRHLQDFHQLKSAYPSLQESELFHTQEGYILIEGAYTSRSIAKDALLRPDIANSSNILNNQIISRASLKYAQNLSPQKQQWASQNTTSSYQPSAHGMQPSRYQQSIPMNSPRYPAHPIQPMSMNPPRYPAHPIQPMSMNPPRYPAHPIQPMPMNLPRYPAHPIQPMPMNLPRYPEQPMQPFSQSQGSEPFMYQ